MTLCSLAAPVCWRVAPAHARSYDGAPARQGRAPEGMIELSSPSPAEPRHGGPSAALTREIFRSERQRALALAILLSLILLATLALFRAPQLAEAFPGLR